ncbi:MAG: hypothetical protein LBK60_06320 [Verrucomicrobiales bacterium]|jgi:hypothetical protein|nr:hypothetical protein [Verrucomicrobiales bacterium]
MPLTVSEVVNEILLLWGVEDPGMSVEVLRTRAVRDLNAATQLLWSRAERLDYFNRVTLTVSFPAGVNAVTLPQNIQQVLGPARLADNAQPLTLLSRRADYDGYGVLYLGLTDNGVPDGVPAAWFVERHNQPEPDNAKVTLLVTPAPLTVTAVLLDVADECPRYRWADYCAGTAVQIPHQYVESILLPVCRHSAMTCQYFTQLDRKDAIEADYQSALTVLGLVDTQPRETKAADVSVSANTGGAP